MKNTYTGIQKITAWILLVVMGIHCFGNAIPSSGGMAYATDYEREEEKTEREAGEETEETDAAEDMDENTDAGQEDTEEMAEEEQQPVGLQEDMGVTDSGEEQTVYESITITSATTLSEDMEVGDLNINTDLHLNGHKLVVHGNVTLNSRLYMEEGYLVIEGDLIENHYAVLSMESLNDYIEVGGDFVYNSQYYYSRTMNKGTVEIKGNICGREGNYCSTSFRIGDSCKVVLSGNTVQNIDIRSDSNFRISRLIIRNTSEEGVLSEHMLYCDVIEDEEKKLRYKADGEFGETLTEDKVIEGDYVLLGGTLDLAGYSLTVKGNLLHAGGTIRMNQGSLTVEGDYRRQLYYTEGDETIEDYSIGRLVMQDEADIVTIKGDYIDSGLAETKTDLTAGTLELEGGLLANDNLRHQLFYATGSHTVKLTGDGMQMLQNGSLYTGDSIRFANLVVAQPETGSTVMSSSIAVTGSLAHESAHITGTTVLEGADINSDDLYGDIAIRMNYRFYTDVTIHGNLSMGYGYYSSRTVSIDHCHVTVEGSYFHTNVYLAFTGEKAVFTIMGDYIMEYGSYNTLNSGAIEIGGDWKSNSASSYLSCQEGSEIRFIGKEEQKVSISNGNSLLTNVVVDNPEGVIVADNIGVINVSCKQGVLSYESGGIHGFTVEEDGEYEGDLVIGGGIFDLNGHHYHVKGNLTIANGALNMTHAADYLTVDGNFETKATVDHSGKLTDGVLEVKGNFTQSGNAKAFTATNNHMVILSGKEKQTVSFAQMDNNYFCNVEFNSGEGTLLSSDVKAIGTVKQTGAVEGYLRISSTTSFFDSIYHGNVGVAESVMLSQGVKIDGQLLVMNSLYLNGKELEVTQDVVVTYDRGLYIQHGQLICESLDMQDCYGVLMQNEDDRITVRKNLTVYSRFNCFSKGKIVVGGDVTFSNRRSNYFDEDVELEMNGTSRQTINMNGSSHYFGTLVLNNTGDEGIYVSDELNYKKLINTSGTKVTFSNGGILGYTLTQDEVIEGDFLLSGGDMDLNGHSLTVKGDLLQSGGTMLVNGGSLLVEGDYCLAKRTENEAGIYAYANTSSKLSMADETDRVTVLGDIHTSLPDRGDLACSAGTLMLMGNLNVWNNTYFELGENVELVLKGNSQQEFMFTSGEMSIGSLDLQNEKGIKFTKVSYAKITGMLSTNGNPIQGELYIYSGVIIKDDIIRGNVRFQENRNLEKDLYIEGDVIIYGLNLDDHHLTVGGDCTLNNGSYLNQTDGILEVKGNLLYYDNYYYHYYQGSGSNQVILSGDKKQTIQSNNMSWKFHELVIRNTSDEGVYAAGLFEADIITDPDKKLSFYTEGDVGYVLTKDTVIQGDFTLLAGTMDLNGHKLTIMGDLLQRGGCVDVNSGRLEVYGNYTLENKGRIILNEENDYAYFGKNVTLGTIISQNDYLTAGTMELKGSLTYQNSGYLFSMSSGLNVRFSGEERQTIVNTGDNANFTLGTVFLENTSAEGVVAANTLYIKNPVKGNGKLNGTVGKTLYWNNGESFSMESWTGNFCIQSGVALSKDFSVDGTLTVGSTLDLNAHHLIVGSLDLNASMYINEGILQVKNDFVLDAWNGNLYMQQDSDVVQVTGNVTATRGTMNLAAGILDIKGNVNLNGVSLNTSGTHRTILSGKMTSRGTAYIQNVTVREGSLLNTLVLTKPRDYYAFNREAEGMCRELIEDIQDIIAPSVPTGLTVTDAGCTSLKLSWQVSTDDTGVVGYDIYRDDRRIMSVSGNTYTDKNLKPGTEYSYYVIAKDATLNTSAASKTVTAATLEDTEAPALPGVPELSECMATSLRLTWEASGDNVKTTGYRIYRDGEEIGTTSRTEYWDASLLPNSSYAYSVSAYDDSGNESAPSEEGSFYTQAVAVADMVPANYAKLSGSKTEFRVSFANAGSTSGYQVFIGYRTGEEEEYTKLLSGNVGKGTAYRKIITAAASLENASVEEEEIEVVVRITDAGGYETEEHYTYYLDKTPPQKLSEVGAEVKNGVAVISYAKGTAADTAGYHIYREEEGKERELLADIADKDKTYYYDRTVKEGVTYTYYAAAYDEDGQEGELSDAITVTGDGDRSLPVIESVEPVDEILYGTAKITVKASDNKLLDKAVIEYYDGEKEEYVKTAECPFTDGTAVYEADTASWGEEASLRFTVYDAAGNQNEGEYKKTYQIDNKGPGKITGLEAKVTSTTAVLSWNAPADDDFSYFSLEEQSGDGSWKEIARTTIVTGYALEGLLPHSTHTYRVTGYDIRGNAGEPSEYIEVHIEEDITAPRITSVSPNGGYYSSVIPLVIKGYDNTALSEMVIEYSTDQENWNLLHLASFDDQRKENTVRYDFDLAGIEDGDLYIRAYCKDTSGNEGDKEQVLIQYKVDKTAPAAVDRLTAEGQAGSIYLSWNEPVDNDVAGYRLYRSVEGLNSYTCIHSSIQALSYYDRSAAYDTSYCYRLTAYDHAGNESEMSNTVIAQKQADDEKPVVYSIVPESGAMVAKTVQLSAYVFDNDKIANVEFALRSREEGSTKITIETVPVNITAGTVTCLLDSTLYPNGEYDICVIAKDVNGNISSELTSLCIIHNVTLDMPDLYAVADDWCVNLHCTIDDSLNFVLYRKCQQTEQTYTSIHTGKGTFMFRDVNVDPRYTYIYQVVIKDAAGNQNQSLLRYVKPNAVDAIAPVAVINTNTSVVEAYETTFSGSDSTDNDKIVRYTWDFGDGSAEVSGSTPKHAYQKAGEYIIKLTVEDASGNTDYTTTKITVLPKQGAGTAVVTVCNAAGTPLKDVIIYVNSSTSGNDMTRTDNKGKAVIMQKPGTYKIALYKPGYVATEESVEIELYGESEFFFTLAEGETITGDFTVRQMDFDEIVAAGIDLSDPSNQHVVTVQTKLTFESAQITPEVISLPMTPANLVTPHSGGGSGSGGGHADPNPGEPEEKEEAVEPALYYTIYITQSISWLKDMYEATLILYNNANSQTIVAENLTAALQLPSGLSLAATNGGQKLSADLPDIKGGETCSTTWYIRGDAKGTYTLNATLKGTLQPFDADFTCDFTSNEFEVAAGEGLHLYVYPEAEAYLDDDYYVQFCLTNESDREFYNVKTDFGKFETANVTQKNVYVINENGDKTEVSSHTTDTGMSYFLPARSANNARVILQDADTLTVERLRPGEKIYGTKILNIGGKPGEDPNEVYYKLIDEMVESNHVEETGITVSVGKTNGHTTKNVTEIQIPKQDPQPNPQPNARDSGGSSYTITYDDQNNNKSNTEKPVTGKPAAPSSDNDVKDPINLMTGAFHVMHSPVAVSGGMDFRFHMSYDSRDTENAGELGRGWNHNYEMKLEHNGSLITLYTSPDHVVTFAESDETANMISGTVDGDRIILAKDNVDRTYYQTGGSNRKYVIRKMDDRYILTMGGQAYTFDRSGVLTGYTDEEGKKLDLSKSDEQLVITDPATGKKMIVSYNEAGRIVSVKDPAGNETGFAYEDDCLTKITSKDGNVLSYAYDENGKILTGSENGRIYVENTYDEDGRVTSQISNGDKKNKTTFTYETDDDGNVTAVMKNADGTTETGMSDPYGHGLYYQNAIGGVRRYLYNEQRDMTEFSDMDGSGKTYSYDERGNITEIKENTGKVLTYTYDEDNHITSIKGNDGTDVTYTYNDKGQRTKVESGNGITAEYTYNEYGQVLTEKSALGTIKYTYEDGMLTKMTDYNGNKHSFSYDANGNVISYTDGAGITTDYDVDVRGNVIRETVHLDQDKTAVTRYTYDAYGNMLSKTDAKGNKTEYQYDNDDHLIKEIRPDGTYYEYQYDKNGNLTEIVCPDGETKVSAAYDAAGNTLSVTDMLGSLQEASYSAGGQILSCTQANGGKISYTYYDNGLLKTQTDANGNTSTFTYDDAGRLSTVTDGAGATTTLSYDKDGNLSSVENALGNATEFKYNEYRKAAEVTDNNGNTTLYEYDSALNCTRVTDAEGGVTEFSYDARNRITSVTKKGETKEEDITLSMTYDNLDNVTSITDGEGNTHRMEYNELSQLVKVYDAKGVLTGQYDYDSLGNCISVTDASGAVTERNYDAFGNLIKELNKDTGNAGTYAYVGGKYLSASTDALGNSASYTYDSMGNLETVTNPNGGVTTYQYDRNHNVTDEIIGDEYHVKYTYNAQNLAESKTNSRDQKAEYRYDLLGRIIEQKDEAGVISYTYDGNDNVLMVTETAGSVAELTGAKTTTITRTYDKLNRVTSYDDGRGNVIGYEYDILGNLVTLTYPNGRDVHYTYDKNGNIRTMTDWEGRKTSYGYDENGRLVKTVRSNGTVETRAYDKAGRLIGILDRKEDTEVNHQEYSYDSAGNITEVKQLCEGEFNFTGVTSAKMTYDKNNRLVTYNGENIKYDKDGNMTYGPLAGEMTDFVYDCRNRLIQAGDTKYTYDAENNRIGVETSEKKTTYVVNTQPELSQVLQSTDTKDNKETTICYFYGNGLTAQDNGKDYFVYHFNNVGSTMVVTDTKGEAVETYNYTPYGELIDGEYREDIPFLYNGQYGVTTDSNGLYYMRARYYNVEIKRFINQDVLLGALERVSSLNRYAYVEGNPVSYLDPFGLEKMDTSIWHEIATVLSIAGVIIKKIGTVTVQPILITVGEVLSIAGGTIDSAAYFVDVINDIKAGNTLNAIQNMSNLLISIIGVGITGTAISYRTEAEMAANFNGISAGWENTAALKYDLWDNLYGTIQTAAALAVQAIQKWFDILD